MQYTPFSEEKLVASDMHKLNFPHYEFKLQRLNNKNYIFDSIRKKYVFLSPEEWVRQHIISFLVNEKNYSPTLIAVEKTIKLYNTTKRYDIVIYRRDGSIDIVVECKSPSVNLTNDVFDQVARYNLVLKSDFFCITNGLKHYFYKIDHSNNSYEFITNFLPYN